jgi:hypothetical protein
MGFLRRLFGGSTESGDDPRSDDEPIAAADRIEAEAAERARELDLLREEHGRLDELGERQLRYAKYAWTPPAQGGERRAEDEDAADR